MAYFIYSQPEDLMLTIYFIFFISHEIWVFVPISPNAVHLFQKQHLYLGVCRSHKEHFSCTEFRIFIRDKFCLGAPYVFTCGSFSCLPYLITCQKWPDRMWSRSYLTPLVAFRSLQTYTQAHKQWPLEPTNSLTWGDSWSFLFIFFLKYKSKYVPYSFFQLFDIIQSQQNHINCVTRNMDKQCCPSYVVQVCSTAYIDLKHKIP